MLEGISMIHYELNYAGLKQIDAQRCQAQALQASNQLTHTF